MLVKTMILCMQNPNNIGKTIKQKQSSSNQSTASSPCSGGENEQPANNNQLDVNQNITVNPYLFARNRSFMMR